VAGCDFPLSAVNFKISIMRAPTQGRPCRGPSTLWLRTLQVATHIYYKTTIVIRVNPENLRYLRAVIFAGHKNNIYL
jgi:hypothetical protein